MDKPFRDGTTLDEIMQDGWSRGFNPEQTVSECVVMGFTHISLSDVVAAWKELDDNVNWEAMGL